MSRPTVRVKIRLLAAQVAECFVVETDPYVHIEAIWNEDYGGFLLAEPERGTYAECWSHAKELLADLRVLDGGFGP